MNIPSWYWLIVGLILIGAFYFAQTKFRDKMLCTFRRPSRQKIEQWVPLDTQFVVFDRGKYGVGRYHCDSTKITHQWYNRGMNKLFPILVPTLDFRWNSTEPIDPDTGLSTHMTPEFVQDSWNEFSHHAYSKGVAAQGGKKERFPAGVIAAMCLVLICGLIFYTWKTNSAFTTDLNNIVNGMNEQKIGNTIPPTTHPPVTTTPAH